MGMKVAMCKAPPNCDRVSPGIGFMITVISNFHQVPDRALSGESEFLDEIITKIRGDPRTGTVLA